MNIITVPCLIFMDLEMTRDIKNKRLFHPLEISLVQLQNSKPEEIFHSLIKTPNNYIHPSIQELTGITEDMLDHAPNISEVSRDLEVFLASEPDSLVLCVWGVEDERWFKSYFKNHFLNKDLPLVKFFNVQNMAQDLLKSPIIDTSNLPNSMSLASWVEAFGMVQEDERPHRAGPDARQTARVFMKLRDFVVSRLCVL